MYFIVPLFCLQSVRIVMEGLDESRDYINVFTFVNDTREVLPDVNRRQGGGSESAAAEEEEEDAVSGGDAAADRPRRKAFLCTNQTKTDLYRALGNLPPAPPSVPSNITKAIQTAIHVEELVRYYTAIQHCSVQSVHMSNDSVTNF